jgi:hypothetical protein
MNKKKLPIYLVCLVFTFIFTGMAWGQVRWTSDRYQGEDRGDGSYWGPQRLVTSKPGHYKMLSVYDIGHRCHWDDDHQFKECYYQANLPDRDADEDPTAVPRCYDMFHDDYPALEGATGVRCLLTDYCDSDFNNRPSSFDELYEYWFSDHWVEPIDEDSTPCGEAMVDPDDEDSYEDVFSIKACVCTVYQGPYIDGAQKDDILFYPAGGLDWANADPQLTRKYTVATAFFTKLWPQYGLNSPFHVAYCYTGMTFNEHHNEYISKEGNQTSEDVYESDITFYNPGSICTEIFDNRAVLDVMSWDMGCDGNCWVLFPKSNCCCELEWINDRDPINVALGMGNMQGEYHLGRFYKPSRLHKSHFGKGDGYPYLSVTAGTGIRDEHNWSGVGGVWAYATNRAEIDDNELHARRKHMQAVAGDLPDTEADYDPDAPYKYNFGGYTSYHKQSGCSQTMADTLRHVGQITTCQGYNTTYVPECVMEGMGNKLIEDFYDFCVNMDIPSFGLSYCLGMSESTFCERMASSILYGFMGQYQIEPSITSPQYGIPIPAPRVVHSVSSPADLWDRLFSPPLDGCGPLRTGDPGHFSSDTRDCVAEVGKRCSCTYPYGYCWCHSDYDNWCPISWYDACDGCDEGCQFTDPDCTSPNPDCRYYDSSQGYKGSQCGNNRCDIIAGEKLSNCTIDCIERYDLGYDNQWELDLKRCCFDNCAEDCLTDTTIWIDNQDIRECMSVCGETRCPGLHAPGIGTCALYKFTTYCGDGQGCVGYKNCTNCPQDCPECHYCGNGKCNELETHESCPEDCDECYHVVDCNDNNPCTTDSCVGGVCVWENNSLLCDDGIYCNGFDTCSGGNCVEGSGSPCNPHSTPFCNEGQKRCVECEQHGHCDDNNPCTEDVCSGGDCYYSHNAMPCDDGDYCNGTDTCEGGECRIHTGISPCGGVAHCSNDLKKCVQCLVDSHCDDDEVCTTDFCDALGNCYFSHADNVVCDDGKFCNGTDICLGGTCSVHSGDPCGGVTCNEAWDQCAECENDSDCPGHGELCVVSVTCLTNNTCYTMYNGGGSCDDGIYCNGAGRCALERGCLPESSPCTNGDICNEVSQTCEPSAWSSNVALGKSATQSSNYYTDQGGPDLVVDGNTDGIFNNGSCNHTGLDQNGWWEVDLGEVYNISSIEIWNRMDDSPVNNRLNPFYLFVSDDPFSSTDLETTKNQSGVWHVYRSHPVWPDFNAYVARTGRYVRIQLDDTEYLHMAEVKVWGREICTRDSDCIDSNLCTTDICNVDTGTCSNINNSAPCNDGLWCNGTDTCSDGSCSVHSGFPCDDGVFCTDDACDEDGNSCSNTANDAYCDDGIACTNDSCNLSMGGCKYAANDVLCDDGVACTIDSCNAASGCESEAHDAFCDDSEVCTTDSCDPASGCQFVNNNNPCPDPYYCNGDEVCSGGTCIDQPDPCTGPDETCNESTNSCDTPTGYCGDTTCDPGTENCSNCTDDCFGCGFEVCNCYDDDGDGCIDGTFSDGICVPLWYCDPDEVCTTGVGCEETCNYECIVDPYSHSTNGTLHSCYYNCVDNVCNGSTSFFDDGDFGCSIECMADYTSWGTDLGSCYKYCCQYYGDMPETEGCEDVCGDTYCNGNEDTTSCPRDCCIPISNVGTFNGNTDSASNDWYGYGRYSGCNNHADDAAKDVCYTWQAYTTGTHTFDACGSESGFDTVLSIHTVDGQELLACNDDNDDYCPNDQSRLNFDATWATYYIIVIDGFDPNDSGNYELVITTDVCTGPADCDDDDACNGEETCVSGNCQPGDPLTCNDSNACTTDSCVPASGCQFVNNDNPCPDSYYCNGEEVCSGGTCIDQPDPCTGPDETCNESSNTCDTQSGGGDIGYTTVGNETSTATDRRAQPVTATSTGDLQSVSIYHNGGSGGLLLAVYADDGGVPGTRLGVTPEVQISSSAGWETVNLSSTVSVSAGQVVWLAWLFESSPGTRCEDATPGRASSGVEWSGGMPADFGSSSISSWQFSIYATYSGGSGGCTDNNQCEDSDPCTDNICSGGTCTYPNNTASCDDGLYCNGTDTCSGGSCTHSGYPCSVGICSEATDTCSEALAECCVENCAFICHFNPTLHSPPPGDYNICMSVCGLQYCSDLEFNGNCQILGDMGYCGDGSCVFGETCVNCETDCGACGSGSGCIVISGAGTFEESTTGESNDYLGTGGDCDGQDNSPDVCYEWSPTVSGDHNISLCNAGTFNDTILMVWNETSSTQLACNDDAAGCDMQSELDFNATVGTTYIIVVDGWRDSDNGAFDLIIEAPAGGGCTDNADCDDGNVCTTDTCNTGTGICSNTANTASCDDNLWCNGTDTCSGGSCSVHQYSGNERCDPDSCNESTDSCESGGSGCIVISGAGTFEESTTGESNDYLGTLSDCDGQDNSPDVCYEWSPTVSGEHNISLCNAGSFNDTILMVWDETSSNELVCNDDGCGNFQSELDFDADVGVTYIIVVDGWRDSDNGGFVLNIDAPGPCDPGCGSRECGPDPNGCNTTCGSGCTGDQVCNNGVCDDPPPGGGDIGNTNILSQVTTVENRRAQQVTADSAGDLQSITIYHESGGSGGLLLAVYADNNNAPGTRLGVTPEVQISSSAGWETVNLSSSVSVSAGQKVWLAWVFEFNPGIRADDGTPGRAHSDDLWASGMPADFGSASFSDYIYSIYATYSGGICTQNSDCEDSEPCTDNICDTGTGNCTFPANTASCDDDDLWCNGTDTCSGGSCSSHQYPSGNRCDPDTCNESSNTCESCTDDCGTRNCGPVPNGCGDSCGTCSGGQECNDGTCEDPDPVHVDCPCDPNMCDYCMCPGGDDYEYYDGCEQWLHQGGSCDCGCTEHDTDCD